MPEMEDRSQKQAANNSKRDGDWLRFFAFACGLGLLVWGADAAFEFVRMFHGSDLTSAKKFHLFAELSFYYSLSGMIIPWAALGPLMLFSRLRPAWQQWFGRRKFDLALGVVLAQAIYFAQLPKIFPSATDTLDWVVLLPNAFWVLAALALMAVLTALAGFLSERLGPKFGAVLLKIIYPLAGLAFLANALVFPAEAIWGRRQTRPVAADAPNLILISIDALRPDHLSYDGYKALATPNIDQLAGQSFIFPNAYSQADWTYPSVTSLFTSIYPDAQYACSPYLTGQEPDYARRIAKGISDEFIESLPPIPASHSTLAELLHKQGYDTGAFVVNVFLGSRFGIGRGFEAFLDSVEKGDDSQILLALAGARGPGAGLFFAFNQTYLRIMDRVNHANPMSADFLNLKAESWIRRHRHHNFFLWLHYLEPHSPYGDPWRPPAPARPEYQGPFASSFSGQFEVMSGRLHLTPQDLDQIIYLYDYDLSYLDGKLGEFFDFLKKNRLWDNSLIILTADHGDQMLEHGSLGHGFSFYQEEARVPLLIKLPGSHPSKTIAQNVELIDLMPTLLDFSKTPAPEFMQGKSLRTLLEGKDTGIADQAYSACNIFGEPVAALRAGNHLLIYHSAANRAELYDLAADPGAKSDLAGSEPELKAQMLERLMGILKNNQSLREKLRPAPSKVKLRGEDREKLKALGYVK